MKAIRTFFLKCRRLSRRSWQLTLFVIAISVVASEAAPLAYVANLADGISVINTGTNAVVAPVPVGTGPQGVAVTPDGAHAYVANFTSNTVSVIDTGTNAVVATIPVGVGPLRVAITPDGAFAYVTVFGPRCVGGGVWVIDTATNTVAATVALAGCSTGVAITPDGASAYVTSNTANVVSVIDTAATPPAVVATIPVGANPYGIAITPDVALAYVTHSALSGTSANSVSVIDTNASSPTLNTVVATVPVGAVPQGVAITPDGVFAYVANNISHNVSVIEIATNSVVTTVPVGFGPVGVAITPDGAFAYVANSNSDTLSVIDTAVNSPTFNTVVATVPLATGVGPRWIAIANLDTTLPDTSLPDTSLLSGPAEGSFTNSTAATFTFSGTDDQTDSTSIAFACSLDGASSESCTSPQTYSDLADGQHTFAVRAVDEAGNMDPTPAVRTWTVDTTPPSLFLTVTPQALWPPNHQMVAVTVTAVASGGSGISSITLVSATSNEPDPDASDIQGAELGTLDTNILLRAERAGVGGGRIYTLTYQATDQAGKTTTASVTVTVPASQGSGTGTPPAAKPHR